MGGLEAFHLKGVVAGLLILGFIPWGEARGQQESFPTGGAYDPIQAGYEAWRRGEARRRDEVARQLWRNEQLRWQAYTGPYAPYAWGESIYYGDPAWSDPFALPGYGSPWGWSAAPRDYFAPRWIDRVPQPIGQWNGQTGPTTWESHPIFPSEERPPADFSPPPAERRELPPPRAGAEQPPAGAEQQRQAAPWPDAVIPPPPPAPRAQPRQF